MVYAAPPRRARDECLAARGGLCGGDGIPCRCVSRHPNSASSKTCGSRDEISEGPVRTELTSGTPLSPSDPRSGVVEALQRRGGGVHRISAGADSRVRRSRRVDTAITTTRVVSFSYRHCYSDATIIAWTWVGGGWLKSGVEEGLLVGGERDVAGLIGWTRGCRGRWCIVGLVEGCVVDCRLGDGW